MSTLSCAHDISAPVPPLPPADQVPASLRNKTRWVCWRYDARGGKPTKVPIHPSTGRPINVTDSAVWRSFDQALESAQSMPSAGVGYVFAPGDGVIGIDIDDCIDCSGAVNPSAQAIIDSLDTYTEVSPSGRGVKCFAHGEKPAWAKCRSGKIEIYSEGRFFTVTGDQLAASPPAVEARQSEIDALCAQLWPPPCSAGGAARRSRRQSRL